jgi:hypothetical protein
MASQPRHPFKAQERDERAHPLIERYLSLHGADGTEETVPRFGDHATMNGWRLSLNRGARHFGLSPAVIVIDQDGEQCYLDCADPAAPHGVRFAFFQLDAGKAHVLRQSNGQPGQMKYNPYLRGQAARQQRDRPYAS